MLIVVMGVAGAGKTVAGQRLAAEIGVEFHDADDFHSPEAIAKMRRAHPLDDSDRAPWLRRLGVLIATVAREGRTAVLACSALKESYRARLREGASTYGGEACFVYLRITPKIAKERVRGRRAHYMPASLIQSQFDTLEEPSDAIVIDADKGLDDVVADIRWQLEGGRHLRVAKSHRSVPAIVRRVPGDEHGGELPLSTLLSHVLVAFTIELDNEFEREMPHRTTSGPIRSLRAGPWLVSLGMWSNLMRFVSEEGVPVRELENKGGNLAGMERWGYVAVAPDPADPRPRPPRRDWLVRATAVGRTAQGLWRRLLGAVERRWETRFGEGAIETLRQSLEALAGQLDLDLPHYLPVLGYGLRANVRHYETPVRAARGKGTSATLDLAALLSQLLFAFTIDFERESELSLAICANVIRFIDADGLRVRDLPRLAGVSKEAINMAVGFLEKRRYVVVEADPVAARARRIRLTAKGQRAKQAYRRLLEVIEERWRARFGTDAIRGLRASLERIAGEPGAGPSPLLRALQPYPEGWRASTPKPETLPHYPMVLHRGGYPDGS